MLGIGGIAAAVNLSSAARQVSNMLQRLRHLGLDILSITTNDGEKTIRDCHLHYHTKLPCEGQDFQGFDFDELPGDMAIGSCADIQKRSNSAKNNGLPHIIEGTRFGSMAIAVSGKIVPGSLPVEGISGDYRHFSNDSGLDKLVHLIFHSQKKSLLDILLVDVLPKLEGAYSIVIMTKEELFAARSPRGIFPLFLGSLQGGILVSSEDVAFHQNREIMPIKEISPGELILVKRGVPGFLSWKYSELPESFCAMMCIHMSSPMTTLHDKHFEDFRQALGEQMGTEYRDQIRLNSSKIVPVMLSGKDQGTGVSRATGIPYREHIKLDVNRPLTRNRPLTKIDFEKALKRSYQKTILRSDRLTGQRIAVVDGTMVTAMNMRVINYRLRQSGAKEITTCITSPPVINPCPFGMEHSDKEMLIASNHTFEKIQKHIGTDTLMFLSLNGLKNVLSKTFGTEFCTGCFGGEYPE